MKYKLGDYVANDETVCLKVVAIIEGDLTIYGLLSPKDSKIIWESQFECDQSGYKKVDVDTKHWHSVEAGDLIKVGTHDKYAKVLARVNDVVLLSNTPVDKKALKTADKIIESLEELEEKDEDIAVEVHEVAQQGKRLRQYATTSGAQKVANGWWHIDKLAHMNWQLIRE